MSTRQRIGLVGLVVFVIAVALASYLLTKGQWAVRPESAPAATTRPGNRPPGFQERAQEAGLNFRMSFLPGEQGENYKINLYDHGSGIAVGDYDGDGRDDIYLLNQLGPNALYHNNGDGTFADVTAKTGVGLGDRICVAAAFVDYDNSGRQSLFVTSTRGGNVLFKNLGDGMFKDVTKEAGLSLVGHCQNAIFFDYDRDGHLDLLLTHTAEWTTQEYKQKEHYYVGGASLVEIAKSPLEYNVLYHNNGDGTFTDVTEKSGLKGTGWSADATILDYDGDGYADVLVTCMFGAAQLYHNNGNGTFSNVTQKVLGRTTWGGMGCRAFDFNNDGKLDLYIVDMHSDMWLPAITPQVQEVCKKYEHVKFPGMTGAAGEFTKNAPAVEKKMAETFHIQYHEVLFGNTFFKNLGNGQFVEMSDKAGLETFWPWGIATGDFDNDGFEDIFVPSGMGYPFFYWPNALLMNAGNETFVERAASEGVEPPAGGIYLAETIKGQPMARSSRSAAVADFRGTGQLDLVVNNFNDRPYYFQNQFPHRHYLEFRLQGTRSNRDAIGAVVRLYSGDQIFTRQVNPASGYLAQSSKTVHFGLGDRAQIDRVEITWPSGLRQTIDHPELDRRHDVVEPRG